MDTGDTMAQSKNQKVQALQLDMQQVTRTKSVLNANQVQKLFNTTPMRFQYKRPGKGGGQWSYVRVSYVRRVLNSVFGFDWDFVPETGVKDAYEVAVATGSVVVKGVLTCRVSDENGRLIAEIRKGDYGRQEVKFKKDTRDPLDFGNDLKGANSDCLKRCAAQWGIAADVYDPSEFQEIDIIGSEEQVAKEAQRAKLIKAAQKQLKKGGEAVHE